MLPVTSNRLSYDCVAGVLTGDKEDEAFQSVLVMQVAQLGLSLFEFCCGMIDGYELLVHILLAFSIERKSALILCCAGRRG